MDRRKFMQGSLAGLGGWMNLASGGPDVSPNVAGVPSLLDKSGRVAPGGAEESKTYQRDQRRLFATDTPSNHWVQMQAEAFSEPVCGVVYRLDRPTWLSRRKPRPNGMALGGIDTGCLDLEKNGTFGFVTIFNSIVPRRGQLHLPYLGLSIGGETWIFADADNHHYSSIGWETVYYFAPERMEDGKGVSWTPKEYYQKLDWQVGGVDQIHYWGHYPVADFEYEISHVIGQGTSVGANYTEWGKRTKAPVSVGLRAWSPFVPGDVETSQMPGAVFEVHLRNISDTLQRGTLAYTFPGPSLEESEGATSFPRRTVEGKFSGVVVTNGNDIGYALGAVEEVVRSGGELATNGDAWAHIAERLPEVIAGQPGASVAVDFSLQAGEQKTVRFILSWYSPRWKGGGTLTAGGRTYTHMYTTHYRNALQVAELLADQHETLLSRVLAWQQAVYTAKEIPVWLRESLVNILYLITENALWGVTKDPIGPWCRPEDGLVGMLGDPRDCPWMEAITEAFYGNIPLVYFFPEMAISALRGYKAYQNPDGSMRFAFSRTPTTELATDYPDQYQSSSNGFIYADLVDRYWQCTGDDEILREFYPSIKKNVIFTMNLNTGPNGVISAPIGDVNRGDGLLRPLPPGKGLAFGGEHNGVFGMDAHLGGLHLAQLRIVQRMAEKLRDIEFAQRCHDWIQAGRESMENKLWSGSYYLDYWEPETGKKADLIYAYQLEGEWVVRYHGLPSVFRPDRVQSTLKTIHEVNGSLTRFGAVMFATPRRTTVGTESFNQNRSAAYGAESIFVGDSILLSATYMFAGRADIGLAIIHDLWEDIVCKQGYTWEQPNLIRGDTGEITFGWDFYQNMGLWMLPAALARKDLGESNKPGTLVERVLRAGRRPAEQSVSMERTGG